MSPSSSLFFLRLSRNLSTTTPPPTTSQAITISQLKHKLKLTNIHTSDQALNIYNSYISTHPNTLSLSSTRHAQEFTVRLLAKSNRFSDIINFLESHKSNPLITQEPFLSSLIRSYGAAKMSENAENTYYQMGELGTPRTALSFNSLLNAFVNCQLFDRVVELFYKLPAEFGFVPNKISYGILVKAYCGMGKPGIAIEKMGEMKREGFDVDVVVFNTILHAFYELGKWEEGEVFWDEMVRSGEFVPDVGSYNVKLLSVGGGESRGRVEEVRREMERAGVKPDVISYNYMLKCYCENGMMDEAGRVYGELRKGKGCWPNTATFKILVKGLCECGRVVEAYEVYKDSVKEHKTLEIETLTCLVEGLVREGRKKEGKALAEGLMRRGRKKEAKVLIKAMNEMKSAPKLKTEEVVDSEGMETVVDSDETEKVVDSDETEKVVDSSENQKISE